MEEIKSTASKARYRVLKEIPVECLSRGRYQPRQAFSEEGLNSLAATIRNVGILEPLVVRPLSEKKYEIIAGERRWRAAQLARLDSVPCIVGSYSDEQASQIALIENISRENLNVIEEAQSIHRIVEEFNYTHEEVAAILGKHRSHITNLLRLLKLDSRIQEALKKGELTEAHGKILAGVPLENQYRFAAECIKKKWPTKFLDRAIKSELTNGNEFKIQQSSRRDPNIVKLERKFSDQLGHKVSVLFSTDKSGSINIHFSNLDELECVLQKTGYDPEE